MGVRKSHYSIRVEVPDWGGDNAYHDAIRLAQALAYENPGLTFEVVEDKVWFSARNLSREDISGTQEVQD